MNEIANLKSIGLKTTIPRILILDLFQNSKTRHFTAEDVYRALTSKKHPIGLSTVYRVLAQLTDAGLLSRSQVGLEAGAVFELDTGVRHDHCVCLDCGHIEEFSDLEIDRLQERAAKQKGFRLDFKSLILYRKCGAKDCTYLKERLGSHQLM